MKLQSPLVSIVIPSFQQGSHLRDCIESVASQGGCDVEIFVFDSESDDDSASVLNELGGSAQIFIERDLGQAHAINKGLSRCRGEIIGFLNSDDVLLPGVLRKVIDYWISNPLTDLLYGKARYINRDGEVIGDYHTQDWNWEKFQGECFICQPAAFWSRRIMDKIGFLDQKLHCSLDYDYWLRIVQTGGVVEQIDEYLACSRDYPETKTRSLRGRVFIENVQISLKRLGYVHSFWISQYMDYFKYESRLFWARLIPQPGRSRDWITKLLQKVSSVWARDVYFKEPPHGPLV